jgi:ketosteroid isomerase-like protein
VPFEEIGKSADASKMLASRARRKVHNGRPPEGDRQQQRDVVDAFLAAARAGDFEGLLRVLDPDVRWRVHTPRGVVIRLGTTEVVGKIQQAIHAKGTARRVLVNGEPGIAAWSSDGKHLAVMACTVVDGRIVGMESVTDPARLESVDLPAPPN